MKKKIFSVCYVWQAVTMAAGCSKEHQMTQRIRKVLQRPEDKGEASDSGDKKFVIGVSQGTMNHPFRVAMVDENVKYAEENYPEFDVLQQTDRTIPLRRFRMWKIFWPAVSICC